jgi:hypothetical protein
MDTHCYGFCYFLSCGIGMNLGASPPFGLMWSKGVMAPVKYEKVSQGKNDGVEGNFTKGLI